MKKILYVASSYGHIRSFHIPYIKGLQESGFEVDTAAAGTCERLEFLNGKKIIIPFEKKMTSLKNIKCTVQLIRLLKEEKYDVISVHTSLAAFFVRISVLMSGRKEVKVINTVHGYLFDEYSPYLKRSLLLWAEKLTRSVTDILVVMNRQDYEIAEKYHLYKNKLVLIPGFGIDAERFSRNRIEEEVRFSQQEEARGDEAAEGKESNRVERLVPFGVTRQKERKKLGVDPDNITLIYAAEFSKRKNQQMLIEAMKLLPQKVKFLLAGQGEYWEVCQRRAEHLGLSDRVRFLGHVKNLEYYYYLSDICVSASRSEGLPFNIMEAMAMGLPVVATDVKGHKDLIEPGINGYLYGFGDDQGFSEAVLRLTEDREHAWQIAENNKVKAREFGLKQVIETVLAVYEEER
ncbi:glycosyltransferase family 4 protein [Aminipila butyrica]|uniref:Glycosyltransferase family 4 protein n=1 Tax=Aminipila butyrica TaxID=433296 RepID=A0A858BSU9_9FIRM|nr:glycosyltransferase family 4 protein [Aminipila butyrica]QIB68158.1 glycosyltransferase family 4 protein [Aminipila butyrica]